jgi:hypothetical protein
MVARVEAIMKESTAQRTAVPGAPRGGQVGQGPGTVVATSKESRNGSGGIKEGSRRLWHQRGVPAAVTVCEGNKNL